MYNSQINFFLGNLLDEVKIIWLEPHPKFLLFLDVYKSCLNQLRNLAKVIAAAYMHTNAICKTYIFIMYKNHWFIFILSSFCCSETLGRYTFAVAILIDKKDNIKMKIEMK
jgi:hypothetical protein